MRKAYINGTIYSKEYIYSAHALLVEDQRIKGIVKANEVPAEYHLVDVQGSQLAAGLIDVQIYGGGGVLFSEKPSLASLDQMTKGIVATGTTSFLLTLATNTAAIFEQAIDIEAQYKHPALLGIHFEGPFLNPEKKGAHVESCIHPASQAEIDELLTHAKGRLKMLTIAPECNSREVIAQLLDAGVILSAGHSNASFEQATKAFDMGLQATTHLFNAMSSFHHRDIGLPGAVFSHQRAVASIIPDGIHVSYAALKLAKKLLGRRLFFITDAVAPTQTGPYIHVLNGDHYALPNGVLSGSALTQFQGLMNAVKYADIPLDEALRMANLYPAELLGETELGHLEEGAKANFIQFKEDKLLKTYLLGEEV